MPNDDAEDRRARREGLARAEMLRRAEYLEAVLARYPELRPVFQPRTPQRARAEALVRAGVYAFGRLRDKAGLAMAKRLMADLERPTEAGAQPRWGRELSEEGLLAEMKKELAAQGRAKPNVSAAITALAARTGGVATADALRVRFNQIAKSEGLRGGLELAYRLREEARAEAADPP